MVFVKVTIPPLHPPVSPVIFIGVPFTVARLLTCFLFATIRLVLPTQLLSPALLSMTPTLDLRIVLAKARNVNFTLLVVFAFGHPVLVPGKCLPVSLVQVFSYRLTLRTTLGAVFPRGLQTESYLNLL